MAIRVNVSSDGTRLTYQVVDHETMFNIGQQTSGNGLGVVHFESRFSVMSIGPGAQGQEAASASAVGTFDCQIKGNRDSILRNLLSFGLKVMLQKLRLPAGPQPINATAFLKRIAVVEHIHPFHKTIEIHAETMMIGEPNPVAGLGPLQTAIIGVDGVDAFTNDGLNAPPPGEKATRGTYAGKLVAAALHDSCSEPDPPPGSTNANGGGGGGGGGGGIAGAIGGGVVGGGSGTGGPGTPGTTVSITVGNLPPSAASKRKQDAWHTDYKINHVYSTDFHRIQCPIAGPSSGKGSGATCEVLTMGNPTSRWVVEVEAERPGSKPILPASILNDPNFALLRADVQPSAPPVMADGSSNIYRVFVRYEYALLKAVVPGLDDMPMCSLPWMTTTFDDPAARLVPADFQHGIIDGTQSRRRVPNYPMLPDSN